MTDPSQPVPDRGLAGQQFGAALSAAPAVGEPQVTRAERYFRANTRGPGIWKWLHYFPIYERHLGKFIGRERIHLLEIGVYSGGSIGMWRDYLGPGLWFYGVDIEPACVAYETERVRILIGDQSDPAFWERTLDDLPPLDVVIDDGGHEAHQQVATLEATLGRLSPGGVYLCEDIHGANHEFHEYLGGLARNLHDMGTGEDTFDRTPTEFQRAIDGVHLYPFVAVIERREEPLDRLRAPRMGTEWQPFYDPDWLPPAG